MTIHGSIGLAPPGGSPEKPAVEFPERVRMVADSVLGSGGVTPRELRAAVAARVASFAGIGAPAAEVPAALAPYVDKVAQHAYKVTDEDIEALKKAGFNEDEIFEITLAAALAAGLARMEIGLQAVRRG